MNREEQAKKMRQIIAKAWMDEGFKQRLLADPAAALKQEGLDIPEGLRIKVVENTDKLVHFVLPAKPSSHELSDEQLDKVAGGFCGRIVHNESQDLMGRFIVYDGHSYPV